MTEPKEIHYLDSELMEAMCHKLACNLFNTKDDPIGKFEEQEINLLDISLKAPQQTFDQKDLHPTLVDKAVALYYALNKNHPFKNGNKRIALTSLIVFLYINDCWLLVSNEDLYNWTLKIAQSSAADRDSLVQATKEWIKSNLVSVEEFLADEKAI